LSENDALARRRALADPVARFDRMLEIRGVEEAIQQMFADGLVKGTTHTCQGQEAVAVALAAVTRPDDVVTCTYRGHGHALALGMSPVEVVGEVLGRTVGSIGGVGGSMHLSDPSIGLLPTFAIVGAGIPVAVGAALGRRASGQDSVGIAIFGDGATNIGAFHEALNLARVWNVPVVFVCENNLYGEYSRIERTTPFEDLHRRGVAYDIPSRPVDGQDVDQLMADLSEEVEEARTGHGPRFVEVKTYRFVGHSRSDTAPYRRPGELDEWLRRDPIAILAERLAERGVLRPSGQERLRRDVESRVASAVELAKNAPAPDTTSLFAHVSSDSPTGATRR
jgi:pyruvate dehydrogenase E1 component alpha subunit